MVVERPPASHLEVSIFLNSKAQQIEFWKSVLHTELKVVAALYLLEEEIDQGHDVIENSRLVLGMLLGRGYSQGVTSRLVASREDLEIIQRVLRKAVAHVAGDIDFVPGLIWSVDNNVGNNTTHARTLSALSAGVEKQNPQFIYQQPIADRYQTIEQAVAEITWIFGDNAMIQCAYRMRDPKINNFFMTFSLLSMEQQAELNRNFAELTGSYGEETSIGIIADACQTPGSASRYIEGIINQRLVDQVDHLISAIPNEQITGFDHANSTLQYRNAIRAFVAFITPENQDPPGDLRYNIQQKEVLLNELFNRKLNGIIPDAAKRITHGIQVLINAIPTPMEVDNQVLGMFANQPQIAACLRAINALPAIARDASYKALIEKIRALTPKFTKRGDESEQDFLQRSQRQKIQFAEKKNTLIVRLIGNRINAITPPRELISSAPEIVEPDEAVDSAIELIAIPAVAEVPAANAAFEIRLKNYLVDHWSKYYKPEAANPNTQLVKDAIQEKFALINAGAGSAVEKRKQKVSLIESICYRLLEHKTAEASQQEILIYMGLLNDDGEPLDPPGDAEAIQEVRNIPHHLLKDYTNFDNFRDLVASVVPQSQVYTNMETIKHLPSINWDQALETYVYEVNAALRRQPADTEVTYWRRIGDWVIEVYNQKVKSHIYPDGLEAILLPAAVPGVGGLGAIPAAAHGVDNRELPDLLRFSTMFADDGDSGYAFNFLDAERPAEVMAGDYKRELLAFEINRDNLNARNDIHARLFKVNIRKAYQRIHAYVIKSLRELFGASVPVVIPEMGGMLAHTWFEVGGFTEERKELCKKVLFIFSYFNRPGNNYDNDYLDMAMLIGRFTHCQDGKKTGIESVASRALTELSGAEEAVEEEPTFETVVQNKILRDFKSNSITAVSDHNHAENTSIVATIKQRNQGFWNVPTAIVADHNGEYLNNADYRLNNQENTDLMLRFFYQHVYAGPHELINVIYKYLLSVDAEKRSHFMAYVTTLLGELRPFSDSWTEETIDYPELLKKKYCEVLPPVPGAHGPDYIFTRKGIEMILFYAGYLAWNGNAHEHPMIAVWNTNLDWLRTNYLDKYNAIYLH